MIDLETKNVIKELRLPHQLREYQWQGVEFLMNNRNALLADEMGLGKTVQVAVCLEIIYKKKKKLKSLIVVPSSLKYNWEKELNIWAPSLSTKRTSGGAANRWAVLRSPFNVLIASYTDIRIEIADGNFNKFFDIVILDEAQKIKNATSSTSKAVKLIKRDTSWSLTGTPIENTKDDLVSIFNFLEYGLINVDMRKNQIHKTIKNNFLRRKKEEVLGDMPPIIEQEIRLVLSKQQKLAYDNYFYYTKSTLDKDSNKGQLLAAITKLKQICNYDQDSDKSIKLDTLRPIVDDVISNGKKILVFSQYVDTLKWIASKLTGYRANIYHGGLNEDKRNKLIEEFEDPNSNTGNILLISLQAGGVGLNLQLAETVVLFDRWWNPSLEKQAIARAHRFGKETPLHVINFLVNDSIEEKIDEIISRKEELFDEYVEGAESFESVEFLEEMRKIFLY